MAIDLECAGRAKRRRRFEFSYRRAAEESKAPPMAAHSKVLTSDDTLDGRA